MWFKKLSGFYEKTLEHVHENMSVQGYILKSHVNGNTFNLGSLETPSLSDSRDRTAHTCMAAGNISISEKISDVKSIHLDSSNYGAMIQAASQFNLLEMVSPAITPEYGIDGYENDKTQGPACAVAAGAGTIYRNYFVDVNEEVGQTSDNQIDCLYDIGTYLGNDDHHLWEMKNGYALPSMQGLIEISEIIDAASEYEVDEIRKRLRVGIQWDTEVTLNNSGNIVSQVYCSALPVAYSNHSIDLWESFSKIVLEATYEATICAAILNYKKTGNNKVYLTLVGGGVFGNKISWIISAIERSLRLYKDIELDVVIVSYRQSNAYVQDLIQKIMP